MPESLITSIQPHYQMSQAADLPERFRYALRVAGPLVALGVNSPFFPPDLYTVDDAERVLAECAMEHRIAVFESVLNPDDDPKVRFPEDVGDIEEVIDRIAADETVVPMLQEPGGRFDDRFAHFRHKHGTYWRWIRPVLDGPSRSAANARIEFRPIPAQPTVRDSVAFLAVFAGLMESLPRREHPVRTLDWSSARENFYAAAEDGLDADMTWITREATETEDTDRLFAELFEAARDGLELRGLPADEIDRYVQPLEQRFETGLTPARWKHREVRRRVEDGAPLGEAIWGMQADYIDRQDDSLIEGCFTDWLDEDDQRA
jgi:PAS domain-containing protein